MTTSRVAEIEALLFAYGEPLPLKKLKTILKIEDEELEKSITEFSALLEGDARGVYLVRHHDTVQLVTTPGFAELLETLLKEEFEESLTPAALETLSIICYAQPITRSEIDYIRGVNSSFTVRSLLIRGLVERSSHPKRPHLYLYRPTLQILSHMGLKSIPELPDYARLQELAGTLRKEPETRPTPPAQ